MKRLIICSILMITIPLLLTACEKGQGPETIANFGKMLAYVPAEFLEDHDVWFGNPAYAQQVYDAEDITSVDELLALPDDERSRVNRAFNSFLTPAFMGNHMQIASLVGWDAFMIDRAMYHETPPPWSFTVNEGTFDTELVREKLIAQGYEETSYSDHIYYRKNDDWQIDTGGEISSWMVAKLNRVAVADTLLITAPSTEILTGILDAMDGTTTSLADDASCRALSQELDDVFYAVLIPRQRIMQVTPDQTPPPFDLEAAAGWEILHEWQTVALGHRDDGTDQYLVISLYYAEKADAEADADNLVARLVDYEFFTWGSEEQKARGGPFISAFEIGEPEITAYKEGAVLTITCRRTGDEKTSSTALPLFAEIRDFLFLVPDPEPYLAD